MSLRQHILRQGGISSKPWKYWGSELRAFCISGKCLFRLTGIDFHILERELKEEGWIWPNETLHDVLLSEERLRQGKIGEEEYGEDYTYGLLPDYFTEEDVI